MSRLQLQKCCCCIDLRTGCLIIAYLNLVGQLLLLAVGLTELLTGALLSTDPDVDKQDAADSLVIMAIIILAVCVIYLIFTILLLVGIYKDRRNFVLAYIVYALFFIVVSLIQFVTSLLSGPIKYGLVLQSLISIGVNIYFVLVIRSYYMIMESKRAAAAAPTAAA